MPRPSPRLRDVLAEAGLDAGSRRAATGACTSSARRADARVPRGAARRHRRGARTRATRMPEKVTMNWWKEERGERIFIDFNQANRDRTMAGAYSPRALPTRRSRRRSRGMRLPRVSTRHPSRCGRCRGGSPRSATRGRSCRRRGTHRHAARVVGTRPRRRARRAAVPARVPQDARLERRGSSPAAPRSPTDRARWLRRGTARGGPWRPRGAWGRPSGRGCAGQVLQWC